MKSGEQYLAELKATTRPIHRMSILQQACNALPSGALTQLYLQLPKLGGRALCKAAPYYKFMTSAALRRAAKGPQLLKTVEEDSFSFFETPNKAPAQKSLFILFGGNQAQFLIPLSAVLYLLPNTPKDVAVIFSKQKKMFYVNGVAGMGRTAFEVAGYIQARIDLVGYDRVVVMGTSSGGVFAQEVAGFLEADVALSFAAAYSEMGFLMGEKENQSLSAFEPMCACRPQKTGRMVNLFAANNTFDYMSSRRIKAVRPKLFEVCLPHRKHHNVLQALVNGFSARLYFKVALAKSDFAIRLLSNASRIYGIHVVRRIQKILGLL